MELALLLTMILASVAAFFIPVYLATINKRDGIAWTSLTKRDQIATSSLTHRDGLDPPVTSTGETFENAGFKTGWTNWQRATDTTDYAANFTQSNDRAHGGTYSCKFTGTAQPVFPKKGTLSAVPASFLIYFNVESIHSGRSGVWFGCTRDGDGDLTGGAVGYKRLDNGEIYLQHLDGDGSLTGGTSSNNNTPSADTWYYVKMSFAANGSDWDVTVGWYNDADVLQDSCTHTVTAAEIGSFDYGIVTYNSETADEVYYDDLEVTP